MSLVSQALADARRKLVDAQDADDAQRNASPVLDGLAYVLMHPIYFAADVYAFAFAPSTEMASGAQQSGKNIATLLLTAITGSSLYTGVLGDIWRMRKKELAVIFIASALWTDTMSGLLHIILDNPKVRRTVGP